MERLSAMLQRKEQELLLQREREAAANAGASTLELKLMIQEKYAQLKEKERKELETITESPQAARSNVIGLLARRVNKSNADQNTTLQQQQQSAQQSPQQPLQQSQQQIPQNTNYNNSLQQQNVNTLQGNQGNIHTLSATNHLSALDEHLRRPSIDEFMESPHAFNPALSTTEVAATPADRGYSTAISHIYTESGLEKTAAETNTNADHKALHPLLPIAIAVVPEAEQKVVSTDAVPTITTSTSPPGTPPPILPRSSSKRIGALLQQESSLSPQQSRSAPKDSNDNLSEYPSQLNIPMPSRFATLRNNDWAGVNSKQPLSSNAIMERLDPAAYSIPVDETPSDSEDPSPRASPNVSRRPTTLKKERDRNLVLEGPAWTVATISSLKECYMFLFNDILVITKPYERRSSKRIYFKPTAVVNLSTSRLTFNDPSARHPNNGLLMIDQDTRHKIETVVSRTFESHPVKSVSYLISKGVFPRTPSAVATFLLTTPRLSKVSLGKFLALQSHGLILQAYMRFFNFTNIDLVSSFRMILCAFRLPTDENNKVDVIIDAFVERWLQCNPKSLARILPPMGTATSPSPVASTDGSTPVQQPRHWQHDSVRQVVFGLLALDFEIHYAQASVKEESVFLTRFITSLLPSLQASLKTRSDAVSISSTSCEQTHRNALVNIFNSIADERLDMGEISGDKPTGPHNNPLFWIFTVQNGVPGSKSEGIPFTSTTPFLNLTVNSASPLITLRISQPVANLQIEVSGVDVTVEPRVLDFSGGVTSAAFKVTGLSPGRKVVLFTRRFARSTTGGSPASGGSSNGDAVRGLENPAGIGVLVEPEWLKYRFAVEENATGMPVSVDDTIPPPDGQVHVVAVSSEAVFVEWEEVLIRLNGGQWEKNAMELTGNNPYGTLAGGGVLEASKKTVDNEERIKEVKRRLFANEQPISRGTVLLQCGAIDE